MGETECLTDWQLRIRDARTPGELMRIAEELRMRSEEAKRGCWLEPAARTHAPWCGGRPRAAERATERIGHHA